VAFAFDYPFLLAAIENGFFVPMALMAYLVAPAWMRVPKAHHLEVAAAACPPPTLVIEADKEADFSSPQPSPPATHDRSSKRSSYASLSSPFSSEEQMVELELEQNLQHFAPTEAPPPPPAPSLSVEMPAVLARRLSHSAISYLWLVLPVGVALAAQFIFFSWATFAAPVSLLSVAKAAQPVLTALFGLILFGKRTPWYIALILVAIGAGSSLDIATVRLAGNVTNLGAVLSVLSAFSAVMRSLLADRAMVEYSALKLMLFANPVSFLLCAVAFFASGELSGVIAYTWSLDVILYILMQAVFESILLLLSLAVIEYTSAVTQSVTATASRPATVVMSVVLFSEPVTLLPALGMLITFAASFLYALAKWPTFTAFFSRFF